MLSPNQKAKLLWRSRRGMVELDLVLNAFIQTYLDDATVEQINDFEKLLTYDDPDIFDWLVGASTPEDSGLNSLVQLLKSLQISLHETKC